MLFLKGFPVVRGRVDLHRAPKWTDSTCQTVYFPPYRFYPDKQVHVTVNHVKLNDSVTVHENMRYGKYEIWNLLKCGMREKSLKKG